MAQAWRFTTKAWLGRAASNLGLRALFIVAAIPRHGWRSVSASDVIMAGAVAVTGLCCLVRPRPRAVMSDWRAVISGAGSLIMLPLMAQGSQTPGVLCSAGAILAILGASIAQVTRVYMGRSFSILPANRGIIASGPYRAVRHPLYLGCLMLAGGFCLAYPSAAKLVMLVACLLLTFVRINLEEQLLSDDEEYRTYCGRVRYRLLPGIY